MPSIRIDDVELYCRLDGDPALPALLFSNSLGTDLDMWDEQAAALSRDFHVVRYDTRGHGRSSAGSEPVTLGRLGRDALAVLDHIGIARAHFCGISMGGMTGQWLAIHASHRLDRIVLANTAARIGSAEGWHMRAGQVRREGMGGVADGAAGRWFTPEFIAGHGAVVNRMIGRLREQSPEGYARCCDALAHADLRTAVGAIRNPVLVIAGRHDPVTTVADAEWLGGCIGQARVEQLDASHLSSIEAGAAFTARLREFLVAER
ncbi:3-oxoadipate enol-lactonase [Massilia consociata]|uniref:3-oxoadipate enol-lactonase n=1 Tax=Massilia consociata TaxID=760117 RepID=A0ABV6FG94_9BURK